MSGKPKSDSVELHQLKIALYAFMRQLNAGVDHLDQLSASTVARALGELLQETVQLPEHIEPEQIVELAQEILTGTAHLQDELAARWEQELKPQKERAIERADALGHTLADFTCLSSNGQRWGAICVRCLEWIYVTPEGASGVLLEQCQGSRY